MLREVPKGRIQINNLRRRWFTDESLDLFIFLNKEDELVQLQICYDKTEQEHVFSWKKGL